MRVLITGGAGFIGRHISDYLEAQAEVRVLDNRSVASNIFRVKSKCLGRGVRVLKVPVVPKTQFAEPPLTAVCLNLQL